jgi:hypothetical protein
MPNRAVDISKALPIEGWMTEKELFWLGEQAQTHKRIVEFGSFCGRSTRALCDNAAGWVMAVDDWRGAREDKLHDPKLVLARFKHNLHGVPCELRIVTGDHTNNKIIDYVSSQNPDMVFLDGSHELRDVASQLMYWKIHMNPGSLLCGHDGDFPGVTYSVINILGSLVLAPETAIWYATV